MTPVPGWRDEDASTPKPDKPCKCGATSWSWFKPEARWACSRCGEYATRKEKGQPPPPSAPPESKQDIPRGVDISIQSGRWAVTQKGKQHILQITPDEVQITSLVGALKSLYPSLTVTLDKEVSENPYVQKSLSFAFRFFPEPLWEDIERALARPKPKRCSRCVQPQSWYDPSVNRYHCSKCGKVESYDASH